MSTASGDFGPLKVSTHDLPERDRFPFWQDFFSQNIVRCNFKPLSTLPLRAEATLHALPDSTAAFADVSKQPRQSFAAITKNPRIKATLGSRSYRPPEYKI